MKVLKGFVTIQHLLSNAPGVVSPIGELSPWGMTYSREVGEYTRTDTPGYRLLSMYSYNTASGPIQADAVMVRAALLLAKNAVAFCTANPKPYSSSALLAYLQTELFDKATDISFGPFVHGTTIGLPEWISCKTSDGADSVKIWLADDAFCSQYDESKITVVAPFISLDTFFGSFTSVSQKISKITMPEMVERIQDAKQEKPETFVRSLNFDYVNPTDITRRVPVTWSVLINGVSGDNIDSIKDALVDYILTNTTKTRAEWEAIFPDIFKRTEFVLLPRWDKMSVQNLTLISGLYSSMMKPRECLTFAKTHIGFYPDTHIDNNMVIMPFDYKAVVLLAVGGPDNQSAKAYLPDVFPDYLPVPNTSLDFSRMKTYTQDWVTLLGGLLVVAESATEFSSLPQKIRRVFRDNKLYVSAVYDNVSYLVATRSSYNLST